MEEMAATEVIVRIDGQQMTRGHPSAGRFTIHGIANGWHTVEVVVQGDQGTMDLGEGMVVRFQVERGESLLGSMAKRVKLGEFSEIDARQPRNFSFSEMEGLKAASDVPCAKEQDFTLVTAAINIGRRHGNISFEDDYIGNLRHILSLGCAVVIHLQQEYVRMIEPFLHERASIRIKEIADLEAFKHAASIESLRTSHTWEGSKKAYNPAKMRHYNALVMSKVYWLAEVAREDPFETPRFLWIDAGLCVRFVQPPLDLGDALVSLDRFLVYSMHYDYSEGLDVHGFPQEAHFKFTGQAASQLLRGNILGGSVRAVEAAVAEFDGVLEETLHAGYMGTEESVMTVGCARARHLCEVVSVSENHLATEMPCSMFLRISASGPRVAIDFPPMPTNSGEAVPLHPEAFFVSVRVSNFVLGRDGSFCITWAGGRRCSDRESAVLLTDLEAATAMGDLEIRAELLGRDGLPVASSGAPLELAVSPAMSEAALTDYGGVWLDSRAGLGGHLAARGLSGAALVVGNAAAAALIQQVSADVWGTGEYSGGLQVLDWPAPSSSSSACSAASECRLHLDDVPDAWREAAAQHTQLFDLVYLCPPLEAVGLPLYLRAALDFWFSSVRGGGTLAGSAYFTVLAPGSHVCI